MKAIEVTEDNFEALLAYDDLFLDYFNVFLRLPAFPQPLYYNRLTGTFQEVEDYPFGDTSLCNTPIPAQFAPSEEERERILEWAKRDRLPLFLRTQLFLEYKLCKLLVRSLEDRGPSRQSSRSVYGYSRQTTSFASSSLGNSHPRSTYDNESEVSEPWASEINRSGILGRYLKPGSRAQSVPSYVPLGLYTSNVSANLSSNQNSSGHFSSKSRRAKSGSAIRSGKHEVDNDVNSYQPVSDSGVATTAPDHVTREGTQFTMETHSDGSGGKKSALRTPNSRYSQKKHTTIRIPHIDDQICNSNEKNEENAGHERKSVGNNNLATLPDNEDYVFGDTEKAPSFVEFDDDPEEYISDVQTEADLREMESRHKRTFQQLKEDMLGSIAGMEAFNEFLCNTVGMDMLNFWLDCEKYRDNVKAIGDAESTMKRNRLFRDIQDKYKFKLSDDAKEHIKKAQENEGLSETVFTRTQYDILRRMRTYWVPRFLIHQERHSEFSLMPVFEVAECGFDNSDDKRLQNATFLPSISLVNSLPVRPESCMRLAQNNDNWDSVVSGGHKMEDDFKPGTLTMMYNLPDDKPFTSRFRDGIMHDKNAGGPFQRYLESINNEYLANFLFWQDVTDYGQADDRSVDRLLRMGKAWSIFNRFIALGSPWNIGVSPIDRDEIHQALLGTKDFVEASLFDNAKGHAVIMLQREWLKYLKYDLRTFLECRARPDDLISPSPTPPDSSGGRSRPPRRPWIRRFLPPIDDWQFSYPGSTESQRQRRLLQSLDDAEKINADRSPSALKRKKEKERRKKQAAIARKKLLKEMKKKNKKVKKTGGQVTIRTPGEEAEQKGLEEKEEKDDEKQEITFSSTFRNRRMMDSFKKFLTEDEENAALNKLTMHQDIDIYLRLPDAHTEKRNTQMKHIIATYFTESSKKSVNLPPEVMQNLAKEGDKPKNSTLQLVQKSVQPEIEEQFKVFWAVHLESLEGFKDDDSSAMSRRGSSSRSDSAQGVVSAWKKRRRGRGIKSDPTATSSSSSPPLSSSLPLLPPVPEIVTSEPGQSLLQHQISTQSESESATPSASDINKKISEKVKRRRKQQRYKQPGRQAPTNADRIEFMKELMAASKGKSMSLKLKHFKRYIAKHGEADGFVLLTNDLDFWIEAQRFKDGHHAYNELAFLKKKVEVIVDCFLDSQATTPSVQIDITPELAAKTIRHSESYIRDRGKDPHNPSILEEPQSCVFKEMLPYWAGFNRQTDAKKLEKEPTMTKSQRLTQQRLQAFLTMEEPNRVFKLPSVNPSSGKAGATVITFSLSEGIQFRDMDSSAIDRLSIATPSHSPGLNSRRGSIFDSSKKPIPPSTSRTSTITSDDSGSVIRSRPPRISIVAAQ